MGVILYTHDDVISADVSASEALSWVSETLLKKSCYQLPAKTSLKAHHGEFYNFMPTLSVPEGVCGIKVVNRIGGRIPSLDSQIFLYELATGNLKCIMDGNYITALRTGAVAAHSINILASEGASKISFIGCGNTARATAKVLFGSSFRKFEKVGVFSYKDQAEDFERYLKDECDVLSDVVFYSDYSDLVKNSDVVVSSVTYFDEDIVSPDCFPPGALLVPIHTRGFTECDLAFDKVFVDDVSHVQGFKYFGDFSHKVDEVSSLLNSPEGKNVRNAEDRVLVYNIGLSIHDIKFASEIYNKLSDKRSDVGREFSFEPPGEKFWFR